MKGITNAEIREKFELLESEIKTIKQVKKQPKIHNLFIAIFAITALVSTVMMTLYNHPLFLFFTILGISQMIFFIFYSYLFDKKRE